MILYSLTQFFVKHVKTYSFVIEFYLTEFHLFIKYAYCFCTKKAVFDGKILYTGTLEGYGNIIIIGHGKGYHSLYGHLDEIITQVGKNIRIGQIIGRSGDTGSIIGESLYFEMRHHGKPIEPTAWLSQSK